MKLTINGNDISKYVIVHSETLLPAEQTAIDELKFYIKDTCGVELNSTTKIGNQYEIIINTDDKYGKDGFRIYTDSDKLYIIGGRPRGVLYGVYEFLESYIGWRFLTKDFSYLKNINDINLIDINESQIPVLEYRDVFWYSYFDPNISAKRKVNSANNREIPESLGGSVGYTGSFVHTMDTLLGYDQRSQPCLADPDNLTKTIDAVRDILKKNPDAKIISVSQNDNQNYCKCDKCTEIDNEEESHAGTMIRFVNAVADEFAEDYPELAIHTLAYQYTRKPPKYTIPRDNVIIQLCSIECCFNHALDDDSCDLNIALKEDMKAWSKVCNRIYIWDYTTNFAHYIATFPNFHVIAPNIRFFCENNSKGIFEQGNYQSPSGEFGDLRAYLLAKLLWNPYMSEDEYNLHMDEFLIGYYGKGWKYIKKFIDYMTESAKKIPHFGIYAHPTKMLNVDDFLGNNEVDEWFDKAEQMADNEVILDNIKRARLQLQYFKIGTDFENTSIDDKQKFKDELVRFGVRKSEGRNKSCEDVDLNVSPFDW